MHNPLALDAKTATLNSQIEANTKLIKVETASHVNEYPAAEFWPPVPNSPQSTAIEQEQEKSDIPNPSAHSASQATTVSPSLFRRQAHRLPATSLLPTIALLL